LHNAHTAQCTCFETRCQIHESQTQNSMRNNFKPCRSLLFQENNKNYWPNTKKIARMRFKPTTYFMVSIKCFQKTGCSKTISLIFKTCIFSRIAMSLQNYQSYKKPNCTVCIFTISNTSQCHLI